MNSYCLLCKVLLDCQVHYYIYHINSYCLILQSVLGLPGTLLYLSYQLLLPFKQSALGAHATVFFDCLTVTLTPSSNRFCYFCRQWWGPATISTNTATIRRRTQTQRSKEKLTEILVLYVFHWGFISPFLSICSLYCSYKESKLNGEKI